MLLFAVVQVTLLAHLWRAYRSTGELFGVLLWIMGLAAGLFGNFYETPYNAIPYYLLLGLCLAPVAGELGGRDGGLRR